MRSFLADQDADWEKLSILLNFLISKLPAPIEEDLSAGILEAIDMDSYRVEKQAAVRIQLADEDAEIQPVPPGGGGGNHGPELDRLSNILKVFNDQFGNIEWTVHYWLNASTQDPCLQLSGSIKHQSHMTHSPTNCPYRGSMLSQTKNAWGIQTN